MSRLAEMLFRVSAAISLAAGWVAALIMVGMTGLILTEIVLRSFFARSTHIVEEYVGYGLMTMIFLGLGHSLERGNLIRVDLVVDRLPHGARRALEVAIALVALAVVGFVAQYVWISMARKLELGTVSMTTAATPLWIPEAIVITGLAVFALQLVAYALRLLTGGALVDESASFE
jgi:TRAP-type C4-dicarboxylate transport system permease small subunit